MTGVPVPFDMTATQVAGFILVLMRTSGLFLTSPLFASRNIPASMKAGWALLTSLLLLPAVPLDVDTIPLTGMNFGLAAMRELMVGFILGMAAYFLFVGIQLAGQIIDIQMGLGMVNVIDPMTSTQVSIMGQYFYLVATLVFLAVDGHHLLIRAIADSFQIVPLGAAKFTPAVAGKISELFSAAFFVAFRVGAPVIGALFLTNMAMGVLARTVPQMNVFIVGMPLAIGVGLFMAAFSMGFFVYVLRGLFQGLYRDLAILLRAMT
jgi:flagellar biosynthesis protein FliR